MTCRPPHREGWSASLLPGRIRPVYSKVLSYGLSEHLHWVRRPQATSMGKRTSRNRLIQRPAQRTTSMVFIRIGLTSSLFIRVRRPAAGVDACPTTAPASQRDTPPAGPSRSGRPAGSAARTARCASSPWDPAPPYPPSFRTRRPADEPLRNGPFLFPTWFPGPSDLLSFPFSFPPQVVGPPTADGNRFGAVTCAARIRDKMNRTTIMVQFTQLFQGLFAYSPRSSLSFSRSCRKTIADGRITPAST